MAIFELRLLGPPTLLRDGTPVELERRCALALLAYLVVETDGAHACLRRDGLAALFWPDADPEHARSALRRTLAALTKVFAGTCLTADRENICLSRSSAGSELHVDVERFRSLLSPCHHYGRPAESVCEHCLLPMIEAAALYRGDFMTGYSLQGSIGFDDWQGIQSDNLRCELAGVLTKLVAGMAERRSYQQAISYAQRWVALDPFFEPAQRKLMQLYVWSGQLQLALRHFAELSALLERELGARPQSETIALYQMIKDNRTLGASDVRLVAPGPATSPVPESPSDARVLRSLPAHSGWGFLVGREDALARALDAWEHVRAGDVRVLWVGGEPGIGKTHFADVLLQAVRAAGGKSLEGRCYAEETAAYAPLAQCIHTCLAETADADGGVRHPQSVLGDLLVLAPELHAQYPDLAPSVLTEPPADSRHLFGSVYALCDGLTQSGAQPLLLLMEDVQWADSATLHLLRYLLHRARQDRRRFWLIMTWSDRDVDPVVSPLMHDLLLDYRRAQLLDEITLGRLDGEQTRTLIESTCPAGVELTAQIADAVYVLSEGNPFFAAEICRAMTDRGGLYSVGGQLQGQEKRAIPVPAVLRDAVLARVARLSLVAQEALRCAAVVGPTFDFDPLQQATGIAESALIAALEQASQKYLIQEESREGAPTHSFTHALIPHILRESMSGPRRRQIERRVAQAVGQLQADRVGGVAHNYAAAGRMG